MKRMPLISFLFVFLISTSLAVNIDVVPVEDKVYPGEHLVYTIVVDNNESSTLNLNAITYEGSLSPRPTYTILSGETLSINFDILVPVDAYPMRNSYSVMLKDDKGREWRIDAVGYIQYRATEIKIEDLDYEKSIVPANPFVIKTKIVNMKTPKTVDFALRVHDSRGNIISRNETVLVLKEDEELTLPLQIRLPSTTPPGEYEITATVLLYAIPSKRYFINVLPFESYLLSRSEDESFAGKKGEVVFENNGNIMLYNQEISTKITPFERLFLISKPKDATYSGGNLVLSRDVQPGEKMVLYYNVSYLTLMILPILLALVLLYLYISTIKVTLKKEVLDYKSTDEETDIKIVLRIRNTFSHTIKDLEVFDPLPPFAKEIKGFGTIKGKVEQRGYSKYVKWVVEELKPREEVVLSYHISTKVGLIGKFTLFPAFVEFVHMSKMYSVKSKKLDTNIE